MNTAFIAAPDRLGTLIPVIVFVGAIIFRVVSESAKVKKNKPGNIPFPSGGTEPAGDASWNIREVLDEIKREVEERRIRGQSQPGYPAAEETHLDRKIKAERIRKESIKEKTVIKPAEAVAVSPVIPAADPEDITISSVGLDNIRNPSSGLAHPVFSFEDLPGEDAVKRAVVLREILGPPLGMR